MHKQDALTTLHALRGYFRDAAPPDPDPRRPAPEGIYQHCSDSRVRPSRLLNLSAGEYVFPAAPGAFIPPWEGGKGLDRDTVRTLNLHFKLSPSIKTIIIEGHTDCAAIREIYDVLVDDSLSEHEEAQWLRPWAPDDLQLAFQGLRQQASSHEMKNDEGLKREFEKIVVLQSMEHLHDYQFTRDGRAVSVRDLVDAGKLHVVVCMQDILTKLENGRHPLEVYDHEHKKFRDILDVYCEAFAVARGDFAGIAALFADATGRLESSILSPRPLGGEG